MQKHSNKKPPRRWWPVALLAGLGLTIAVMAVAAPQYLNQLSSPGKWAAYPDLDVGEDSLVAAVWTEGPGGVENKHYGPLILGWSTENLFREWMTHTLSAEQVQYAAIAVEGKTAHVVWPLQGDLNYVACELSGASPSCTSPELVVYNTEGGYIHQPDIVADADGGLHVVWAEGTAVSVLQYAHKAQGSNWQIEGAVSGSVDSDFPALATAGDWLHLVWAEWQDVATGYYAVNYCRRALSGTAWTGCKGGEKPLAEWPDHSARNLSVAADEAGHIYVVWDSPRDLGESNTRYLISYLHYDGVSGEWRDFSRTYPWGERDGSGDAEAFTSNEKIETLGYAFHLRPHVSLATSGTVEVPVLTWHARRPGELPGEPPRYRLFWTYATRPGSSDERDAEGYLYWASDYMTLPTKLDADAATPRIAFAGDLKGITDDDAPSQKGHLHIVYHQGNLLESAGSWAVYYYDETSTSASHTVYMPVILRYSTGGDEGRGK